MAGDKAKHCELDQEKYDAHDNVKIICLGDSAVGKSKYANALLLSAADIQMTQKNFSFAKKFSLPLYFVSAADGTNVVKLFNDAIRLAVAYKESSQDFMDEVLQELENFKLEQKEEDAPDQEQSGMIKSPSPS
uniref:RAB, member RAS oncogene family-like 2 n=1 Tax=Cricetulus griseus TaxID=10029 RepID=A0A8C2MTD0_CRIGR